MEPHATLASWILANAGAPMTHLKLQKLCFYGYGVARALGGDLGGRIEFRAWKHGPVCPDIYRTYRGYRDAELPVPRETPTAYDAHTTAVLADVLAVYGRLSAWELRNQSHAEKPWRGVDHVSGETIPDSAIVEWFTALYAKGRVVAPAVLVGAHSAGLDGIPAATYESFAHLAERCRQHP